MDEIKTERICFESLLDGNKTGRLQSREQYMTYLYLSIHMLGNHICPLLCHTDIHSYTTETDKLQYKTIWFRQQHSSYNTIELIKIFVGLICLFAQWSQKLKNKSKWIIVTFSKRVWVCLIEPYNNMSYNRFLCQTIGFFHIKGHWMFTKMYKENFWTGMCLPLLKLTKSEGLTRFTLS